LKCKLENFGLNGAELNARKGDGDYEIAIVGFWLCEVGREKPQGIDIEVY
jgi:hypothetical protein